MKTTLTALLCSWVLWAGLAWTRPLPELRAEVATSTQELRQAETERARLSSIHEQLATQIVALKARGDRSDELDQALREANRISESLAAEDRRAHQATKSLESARRALVAELDATLARERDRLSRALPTERRALFEGIKTLLAERSQAQSALASRATQPGRAEVLAVADEERGSPDALKELADEAADHRERVRQQVRALEARLDALKARQQLLRAAVAFQREDSLFGEDERGRRLIRAGRPGTGTGLPGENKEPTTGGEIESDGDSETPGTDVPSDRGEEDYGNGDFDGAGDGNGAGSGDIPAEPTAPSVPSLPLDSHPGADLATPLVVDDALDVRLLTGDVGSLSPSALADQIREVERRRKALDRTAQELEQRRRALEAAAHQLNR